jgi:hypothetical protein
MVTRSLHSAKPIVLKSRQPAYNKNKLVLWDARLSYPNNQILKQTWTSYMHGEGR